MDSEVKKKPRVPKGQKRLTIGERVKILTRLEDGEKASDLADEYGVTISAISHIKKDKENILQKEKVILDHGGKITKKRCTGIGATRREESLYQWFLQKRSMGHPISGPLLQEMAAQFNVVLNGPPKFKASTGFLNGFKKRYGIRGISIQGEKLSADSDASKDFVSTFRQYVDDYNISLDYIYNADESGLAWKLLPNKSLVLKSEREAPGKKKSKERVTIMVCANASGTHKIPLLLIGKYKKPRCFRNVDTLPVVYINQQNAWMDKKLMLDWYKEVFLPAIIERHGSTGRKCILLLDNAPSHPPVKEFNDINPICKVIYLPPNVTSLIQPMDQGVIEKVKKLYKKNLLRLILTAQDVERVNFIQKTINLHHCSFFIAAAWEQITSDNLRRAWKSIFPNFSSGPVEDSTINIESFQNLMVQLPKDCQLSNEEIITWLQIDAEDQGWKVLSDEEILNGELLDEQILEEDETQEQKQEESQSITPTEALECTNKLILWCNIQNLLFPELLEHLQKVQEYIANTVVNSNCNQ